MRLQSQSLPELAKDMKKLRAFILAILMVASSLFVVAIDTTPVSAWTASCVFAPSQPNGSTYAGSFCSTNRPGGAFHYTVITCRYYQFWSYHTYTRTGPYAGDNSWSWAYCSNGDQVIHVRANFYPNDQYSGGGSSGSW